MPNEKSTLVTGASGFVGNNLVRQLIQNGRRVRALVHNRLQALDGLNIDRVKGDILCADTIRHAVQDVDVVYHLAAVVSIDTDKNRLAEMQATNVAGTNNVIKACAETGVRLVHFSSVHALSHSRANMPIDESRPLADDPKYHLAYDLSKAAGEAAISNAVQNDGLNAVVINPVGIIGPGDFQPSPSGEFLLQLARRKLPGLVRSGFHWVDVRDVANAAIAAETAGGSGERFILSSEFATFKSIARWVFEETGSRPPMINAPLWVARAAAPIVAGVSRWAGRRPLVTPESIKTVTYQNQVQSSKAREVLGFQPRSVESSVKDAVRWLLTRERKKS